MLNVTTQASTDLTTTNNQTTTTHSTKIYQNDVTWESIEKYVHLLNQCWEAWWVWSSPDYKRSDKPVKCEFKSDKTITDLENIKYPCNTLKEDFSVYIEKVQKLSDYNCPRTGLVKAFDKQVGIYERYDDANYFNKLLTAGTSVSIATVGISLLGAFFISCNKIDAINTEGVSCTTKYWLPLALLASSVVPIVTGSITAAAWANNDLPSEGKDCIEYQLVQDIGNLLHEVTGTYYL